MLPVLLQGGSMWRPAQAWLRAWLHCDSYSRVQSYVVQGSASGNMQHTADV